MRRAYTHLSLSVVVPSPCVCGFSHKDSCAWMHGGLAWPKAGRAMQARPGVGGDLDPPTPGQRRNNHAQPEPRPQVVTEARQTRWLPVQPPAYTTNHNPDHKWWRKRVRHVGVLYKPQRPTQPTTTTTKGNGSASDTLATCARARGCVGGRLQNGRRGRHEMFARWQRQRPATRTQMPRDILRALNPTQICERAASAGST